MKNPLPENIDEELIAPVQGRWLAQFRDAIKENRWDTGWGLNAEKGENGGIISLDPLALPEMYQTVWRGKVTSSSASAPEHTIEEIGPDDEIISPSDGGRITEIAKAFNERKGVPTTTIVCVFEFPGDSENPTLYRFTPWDGLTGTPKDLVASGLTADTTSWDIETDSQPVEFSTGRVWFGTPIMAQFWRDVTTDASGMVTNVSGESRFRLVADLDDSSYEGAIAMVAEGVDGAYLKHNQAQATQDIVAFQGTSGRITVTSSANGADLEFDEGGHYNDGTKTITIDLANDPGDPGGPLPTGCTNGDILRLVGGVWTCVTPVTQTVLTGVSWNATTGQLEFTRETLTVIAKAGGVADTDIQFYDCDGNTP